MFFFKASFVKTAKNQSVQITITIRTSRAWFRRTDSSLNNHDQYSVVLARRPRGVLWTTLGNAPDTLIRLHNNPSLLNPRSSIPERSIVRPSLDIGDIFGNDIKMFLYGQ